jgi:glycogen operon protein
MDDEAWNADFVRSIGMLLNGNAIEEVNEKGELIVGDSLLILLNAHSDDVPFTLPPLDADQQWQRIVDTRDAATPDRPFKPGVRYPLAGRTVAVLRVTPPVLERRRAREAARATTAPSAPTETPETPEPVGAEG